MLDKKKEARVQVQLKNKEKKASDLAQKKAAKEKEDKGKGKGKGKKKDKVGGEVVPSSTRDGCSQMQSGVKRKATLSQLTKEVIMHVTQAMAITENDVAKIEDLIPNISIGNLANDMVEDNSMWYNKVLQFMKKIIIYSTCTIRSPIVFSVM